METFTFWKENKLDKEYTLTIEEIKKRYAEFCKKKEQSWLVYYGHVTVNFFVADKEHGLNSVMESGDYEALQSPLAPIRHKFYPKQ